MENYFNKTVPIMMESGSYSVFDQQNDEVAKRIVKKYTKAFERRNGYATR